MSTATIAATPAGADAARPARENLPRPVAPGSGGQGAGPGKVAAAPSRRRNPLNFLAHIPFISDIVAELRKVTWPTFQETRYLTVVVAIVATAVGLLLGGIDLFFGWVIQHLFF